jgi:predicted N-acetyltransferase YhbS
MLRTAIKSDLPGITALWGEAFGDGAESVSFFFESFHDCLSYVAEEDGQIVSMVHALPQILSPDFPAAYVYAVATAKTHRGRGLCGQLMAFAEEDLQNRGFACCVLTPGEPELFRFYEKLGFRSGYARWEKHIEDDEFFDPVEFYPCSFRSFRELRAEYLNSIPDALVHPDRELGYIYQELCCCGGQVLRFYEEGKLCYAAYSFGPDEIYLREQTGSDPERVARALMSLHGVSKAVVTSHLPFPGAEKREWVMTKDLSDRENTVTVGCAALMLD